MDKKKIIKDIHKKAKDLIPNAIKVNTAPKSTFGTDPLDPWSAKAGITEEQLNESLLDRFIRSLGVDPKYLSMPRKVAYSKSNQFKMWAISHKNDKVQEDVNQHGGRDRVSTSPTEKRVSKLRSSYEKGDPIKTPSGALKKEELEQIDELSNELLQRYKDKAKKSADELTAKGQHKKSTDRWGNVMVASAKQLSNTMKDIKKTIRKEDFEQIDEISQETKKSYLEKAKKSVDELKPYASKTKYPNLATNIINRREKGIKLASEDIFQDPQAATQTSFDMGTTPNQTLKPNPADRLKTEKAKSARIIKAIYKKHRMVKEDMFDHEKEDKSVKTYGKKPKHIIPDENKNYGDNKPRAAATLTGGKTLTGQKRDDVEIDPVMAQRPGPNDNSINKTLNKKKDK